MQSRAVGVRGTREGAGTGRAPGPARHGTQSSRAGLAAVYTQDGHHQEEEDDEGEEEEEEGGLAEGAPEQYLCSITGQLMRNPVATADGHIYERRAIQKWLARNETSPMTGLALPHRELMPIFALKSLIEDYIRDFRKANRPGGSSEGGGEGGGGGGAAT